MTRPYRIHTMPTRRRAVGRVANGESITAVAKDMQLAQSLLWSWCRLDGVTTQHQPITHPSARAHIPYPPAAPEVRAAALALVRDGASAPAAARAVGVSAVSVRTWVRLENAARKATC